MVPVGRWRYHARRSKQIFAIWEEVWGADQRHRLSFILSTWTISTLATREMMQFEGAGTAADLIGVTAYLDVNYRITATMASKSVDEILQDMRLNIPNIVALLNEQKEIALAHGKQLITYEGGPGLVEDGVIFGGNVMGGFGQLTEKLIAVARSDKMEGFYRDALDALASAGVFDHRRPFMAFTSVGPFSKFGSWGHQEYSGQTLARAPKLRALLWAVSNATSTQLNMPPSSCVDPRFGGWGLSVGMRYGPSGVMSPASGDEWIWGREYDVWWNAEGAQDTKVSISLWRSGTCPGSGVRVLVIAKSLLDNGRTRYKVPEWLEARNDYIVTVETARGVFISEPFGISGAETHLFATLLFLLFLEAFASGSDGVCCWWCRLAGGARYEIGDWGTCSQSCDFGVQTREVKCKTVVSSVLAKYRGAMELDALSYNCLKDDQKLEDQWVWNQWLGKWEIAWVKNSLASHWAVWPSWHVIVCWLQSSGCRQYRTARHNSQNKMFPPPYLHGNFKDVLDCTAQHSPNPRILHSDAVDPVESCNLAGVKPANWQSCFKRPCGDAGWVMSEWSTCSEPCGGSGEQSRSVKCLDNSGNEVSGQQCQAAGLETPATQRRCNMAACPSFEWVIVLHASGDWGPCSAACGTGIRVRTVICVSRPSGAVASPMLCPPSSKPTSMERCNINSCSTPHWKIDDWSRCSVPCDIGVRYRNVSCTLGTEIVDDQQCTTEPKPVMSEACMLGPCEKLSWRLGDWSQCSATCGEGSMEREIVCWSSIKGIVDSFRCQSLLGMVPAAVQGCMGGSCNSCGGTPTCSGHGNCLNQTCLCGDGFHGAECELPSSCPTNAVLDAQGECCASGVRDRNGQCCHSGILNACGECNATSAQIDARGACCRSGIVDAGGLCCEAEDGTLDRCGVCGGTGQTCATGLMMVLEAVWDEGLEQSNVTASVEKILQTWLQHTGGSVTVNSIMVVSSSSGRRAGGGGLVVDATVEGGGSLLLLAIQEGRVDMGGGSNVSTMQTQAVGVCGNGVCEMV
jgi:hypothetical protein